MSVSNIKFPPTLVFLISPKFSRKLKEDLITISLEEKNPSYQMISFSTQCLGHALMVLIKHLPSESNFKLG
jgi:hypothetical protein